MANIWSTGSQRRTHEQLAGPSQLDRELATQALETEEELYRLRARRQELVAKAEETQARLSTLQQYRQLQEERLHDALEETEMFAAGGHDQQIRGAPEQWAGSSVVYSVEVVHAGQTKTLLCSADVKCQDSAATLRAAFDVAVPITGLCDESGTFLPIPLLQVAPSHFAGGRFRLVLAVGQ